MKFFLLKNSSKILTGLLTCFMLLAGCQQQKESEIPGADDPDKYDGPGLAAQFEFERTLDPATGRVPRERYLLALEKTIESKNQASAIGGLPWIERGPNSDLYGPFGNSRANNDITSGRIRAMMVDSSDATHKTVFIGGVSGGLWKTTDITASPASWSVINDNLSNLAIAAICQDPRPGFQNIMYFCTGESYYNADAVRGNGVFKSTDYGATWTFLSSTSTYVNGTRILCDYQGNIYLATRGTGLLRSTAASGGAAWTNITPAALPNSDITDMEISSTSAAGRLHITCGTIFSANGYRFTDIPATVTAAVGWTASTTALPSFNNRIEFACSGNTLYALPANNDPSNQVPVIYKSTDGGVNWASTGGVPSSTWAAAQGWYALAVDIDPSNSNSCIIGGLDTWKTTNGGASWAQLSTWVGSSPIAQYVHADVHKIIWIDGGNKLIIASDGGVFYSPDKGVTFKDRNKGLRIKQFYSCAIHPSSTNYFLAGAQDNGVHQFNTAGLGATTEVNGGDGCFVAIDQLVPNNQFGSYVFNVYNRSTDGGTNWSGVSFYKGTSLAASNFGSFVNAWDYDNTNKVIYAGGDGGEFFRWTTALTTPAGNYFSTTGFPTGASILTGITGFNSGKVTAVSVSPYTANRVYFGTNGGRVVYIDGANTAASGTAGTNITGASFPAGTVSCINTGTNDQNLICCFSNYGVSSVWVSSNGGTSWTSLDNNGLNLPDMPVRWCMFYPGDNTKAFIATETGVWQTDLVNGTSTVWNANASFPAVRTDMIKYRSSDRTMAAATHGRGLWTAILPAVATPDLSFQSATDAATESSTFTSGCRGYTDYTKYMVISNTPTGTATVTLSVAGGGTAVQGVDYDITTNGSFSSPSSTLSFASGSGTAQPFTIRVYDDAALEGAESFTLNYTTTGGNAQAGASNQTFIFTLNDNDAAPVANGSFSNAVGTYNANSSANAPFNAAQSKFRIQTLFTLAELNAAGITSARNFTSMTLRVVTKNSTLPYTNFTISMANSGATNLSAGFQNAAFTTVYPATNYSSVVGNNVFNFSTPFAWDGTSNILVNFCYDNALAGLSDVMECQSGLSANLSTYTNAVVSSPCTAAASFINTVRIKATFGTTVTGTAISSALNSSKTAYLGPNDDVYFYDASGNIMARIKNLTAFDYGCTQLVVDRAGSSSSAFWNNAAANYLLSKTYKVVPTNNSTSGSYQLTLYYTAAEVAGWEAATGRTWAGSSMQVVKVSNGFFIPDVTTASPHTADVSLVTGTKSTFGSDFTIRGDFSGTGFSGFGAGVPGNSLLTADFQTKASGNFSNGTIWQYNNEGAGFVDALQAPAADNNVNIQAAHIVALDAGFTINSGKTLTLNGTLNCGNNIIDGGGNFVMAAASSLGIGSAAGIAASGAAGNIQTSSRSFNAAGNYVYNAAVNQSAGSGLPAAINNLVIANSGAALNNTVSLAAALTVNGSSTLTSGILSIGGNTLTLNGNLSGSGTLSGSASGDISFSNLVIGGTALNQTLNFTQSSAASRSLNNLTLSAGSSATLATALDVYGTIALTTAALNVNAQNLTLKSNATNTARIANLTGSTLSGASNVTMERYIKLRAGGNGRAYRLLAPTVNSSGSIRANWMEGGMNTAIGTNDNPLPTYGTQITGAGGNANGFDKTQTNAASLYATANAVTPTYTAVGNTSGSLNALTGYFLYIRGDRSMDMQIPLAANMPTSATTLRATGTVLTGTKTAFSNAFTGGAGALNLVTNPYPSAIDWSLVQPACTNIATSYTFWDPNFGTRGGFVTVNTAGVASSGLGTKFIQSGQAFFVQSTGAVPTVSIQETHKAVGNNNDVFLTPAPPVEAFRTELYFTEPNGYRRVADGAIVLFDDHYAPGIGDEDASEINNWDENIAVVKEAKKLAIEGRPVIRGKDTIMLFMNNMKKQDYEFEFTPAVFTHANLKAELVDNFLGTRTLLSLTDPTVVSFSVTDNPASAATDRFKVVFGSFGNPQGVDAITISAVQQNTGVLVAWTSATETDMLQYEVERSAYGNAFVKVGNLPALGNSANPVQYNWVDANPNKGTNFYRIKGTDKAGNVRYSEAVRVLFGQGEPSVVLYPNPLQGSSFKIDMYNLIQGNYQLRLYSNDGQLIHSETLQHDGRQSTYSINLGKVIPVGHYQLQLSGPAFKRTRRLIRN